MYLWNQQYEAKDLQVSLFYLVMHWCMKNFNTELWTQEKQTKKTQHLENVSSSVMYLENKYLFQINDILKYVPKKK